ITYTALAKASNVMSEVPSVDPAAVAALSAAGNSYITEPIYESLIQDTGPPTDLNKPTIPITITTDGPNEAKNALFAPIFIFSSEIPILLPSLIALFINLIA